MLREVWLNIRVEKINTYEDVAIKALLNSGITEMFINRKTAAKHGFRLQKLERLILVRNIDGTNNSRGAITHQVEANVYYKGYVKRIPLSWRLPLLQNTRPTSRPETGAQHIS